jgi:hypothetical protein
LFPIPLEFSVMFLAVIRGSLDISMIAFITFLIFELFLHVLSCHYSDKMNNELKG